MKCLVCIMFFVMAAGWVQGQNATETASDVEQLIAEQRFQFVPRSADPLRGRTIFLSAGYTLTILRDSIISDLPFYGRAYQASMNPNDAGFKFTSTDFSYTVKERKKGGRDITIKTKDVKSSPQMILFVGKDGTSSLRITSADRETISYSGYIKKPGSN
jgi:hypothetical protein